MGGGARLGDQTFDAAQAGRQPDQAQAVGDAGGFAAVAAHDDAQHAAEAVHLRLRQSVARRFRQARVMHASDLRVTRHGLGHRQRIGIVLTHAHDQRAQAARQQRGGFR